MEFSLSILDSKNEIFSNYTWNKTRTSKSQIYFILDFAIDIKEKLKLEVHLIPSKEYLNEYNLELAKKKLTSDI